MRILLMSLVLIGGVGGVTVGFAAAIHWNNPYLAIYGAEVGAGISFTYAVLNRVLKLRPIDKYYRQAVDLKAQFCTSDLTALLTI